jgi:hypothetical protein
LRKEIRARLVGKQKNLAIAHPGAFRNEGDDHMDRTSARHLLGNGLVTGRNHCERHPLLRPDTESIETETSIRSRSRYKIVCVLRIAEWFGYDFRAADWSILRTKNDSITVEKIIAWQEKASLRREQKEKNGYDRRAARRSSNQNEYSTEDSSNLRSHFMKSDSLSAPC